MEATQKLLIAAMAGIIALAAPQTQARTLRAADVQPADYPTVRAMQAMADDFTKATGEKYSVKVFANGVLGSEKDTIEQVKLGALDFLRINSGTLNTICPAMMLPVLPFMFRDAAHMHTILDGPIGDELLADCNARAWSDWRSTTPAPARSTPRSRSAAWPT